MDVAVWLSMPGSKPFHLYIHGDVHGKESFVWLEAPWSLQHYVCGALPGTFPGHPVAALCQCRSCSSRSTGWNGFWGGSTLNHGSELGWLECWSAHQLSSPSGPGEFSISALIHLLQQSARGGARSSAFTSSGSFLPHIFRASSTVLSSWGAGDTLLSATADGRQEQLSHPLWGSWDGMSPVPMLSHDRWFLGTALPQVFMG